MINTQVVEVADKILSIETVSAAAALILFCAYLFWENKQLKKELKEKDDIIKGFLEKYYVIATKLYDWLK